MKSRCLHTEQDTAEQQQQAGAWSTWLMTSGLVAGAIGVYAYKKARLANAAAVKTARQMQTQPSDAEFAVSELRW